MTQNANERNANQPVDGVTAQRTGQPLLLAFESGASQAPAATPRPLHWKLWAASGAGFTAALVIIVAITVNGHPGQTTTARPINELSGAGLIEKDSLAPAVNGPASTALRTEPALKARAAMTSQSRANIANSLSPATRPPMIARAAALTIQVKDFNVARNALDAILTKHDGYSATLTVETPEGAQRNFQASLRVPARELTAALEDLKRLGRVLTESQSGEEVTQQHTDLLARLKNSHETEDRLRGILQQRTGKIGDVLQVEEEISRVRGEIESMEAEQRTLEHRVNFASVDLQLVEEYKERFNASPISTMGRLRNGFIDGMRNASGTLLGLALLIEEFGPAILIWCVILGLPAYGVWRRYRRTRATI